MNGLILALGSVNADFQVRVDALPGDAEMSIAHELRRLGGGKAANVACLARLLDHPAWLFGRVGGDDLSEQALRPLRAAGIDLEGVSRAANHQTGLAMVLVPPSGKKRIVLAPNANDAWSERAVEAACRRIAGAPAPAALVVDCEVPTAVVRRAVAAARRRGFRVVLDPSFVQRVDRELLACVDVITPNESEARALGRLAGSATDDPLDIARALAACGPRTVCVKRHDGGCLLLDDERPLHIAPLEVELVDTTGAGDAFACALAVALLEGEPPEQAARFAVAASSVAVTAYGSQPAYRPRAAIEAQLREHGATASR